MMDPGERNTRIVFEAPVMADDTYGGKTISSWSTIAAPWCRLKPVSAREQMNAMRLNIRVTHEIVAPYSAALSALSIQHRANVSGRLMNIVSVINRDEKDEELIILAEEGAPT